MELIVLITVILSIVLVALKILSSVLLYKKYIEIKNKLALAFALFFFFLAIDRVFGTYFNYFVTGLDYALNDDHLLLWKLINIPEYAAYFCLLLISESIIYKGKTKHIFAIVYLVLIVVMMFIPTYSDAQLFFGISNGVAVFIIPISFFYLAIKTEGALKNKAYIVFFGILIYLMGQFVAGKTVADLIYGITYGDEILIRYYLMIIATFIKYLGILLVTWGMRKEL